MLIPFYRAQGAGNDFLFSWSHQLPPNTDAASMARAICHRNFGVGADGWYILSKTPTANAAIHLYNSDGSEAELSGNGTRCAAAVLIESGATPAPAAGTTITIETGAGPRALRLLARSGPCYELEMAMGRPVVQALHSPLNINGQVLDATLVDAGNPQCAVELTSLGRTSFDFDWQSLGAAIERHPSFPRRSNVSLFCKMDGNTISARFFERGAGATLSSGTGATGAAVAARARGLVANPVTVKTEAGDLKLRWETDDVYLAGPAQVIARGDYYFEGAQH